MAYVMLGRVETHEDLYITGDFDPEQIRCHPDALEEAQRIDGIALARLEEQKRLEESSIVISYLNVRSLRGKVPDVVSDPILMRSDILGFGETWLHDRESVDIPNMVGTFINSGRGQGVAAFTKEPCGHECLNEPDASALLMKHDAVNVIFMYLSQNFDWSKVFDFLEHVIDPEEPTIIMGDMNWHYPGGHPMKTYLHARGFTQLIEKATHEKGNCIDHIYISEHLKEVQHRFFQNSTYYSDHDILSFYIPKE